MSDVQSRLTAALSDRYTVVRELGAGGMATVFLSRDLKHDRDVAIKVLHPDLGAALGSERFLSEIKTTAKLQHPHILPLLDSGVADGLLYYVMPYVRGDTLRARLTRGPLALGEATELLRNVLQALQHAHDAGVVHRDIKPENILIASGTAVVADFGIAKALSTSRTLASHTAFTQAGTAVGTPAYMAPEQAAGDPHTDFRADLYAWGLVAFEALTGHHPFARHVTPQAMITAQMTELPPAVTAITPNTPSSVAEAIAACLAKDPGDRPASASVALAVFDALRTPSGVPSGATPTGAGARAIRVALGAALVIALVAGAWLVKGRSISANAPRSLAVLPFDIGGDTANTYVADGLTAELTTKLSRIPGLAVRAYSSSRNVRGQDPKLAARELGVATVVTATVRRDRERLHINASLVDGRDAQLLWSAAFDGRDADQFALQDRLAEAIATALEIRLTSDARRAVQRGSTRDALAHDLVQRSRYEADQLTAPGLQRAIAHAQEAIARDSTYTDGWAALANALMLQADDFVPPVTILPAMRHATEMVSRLDPDGAEGHALAGAIAAWYSRDSAVAERELHRALAIDSTNMYALTALASFVSLRHPDSVGVLDARNIRHNPLSLIAQYFAAIEPAFHRALPADSAAMVCTRLRQAVPPLGDNCDALRLWQNGKQVEGRAQLRNADTTGMEGGLWAGRALAASLLGDDVITHRFAERATLESSRRYARLDFTAIAWTSLGDRAQALRAARQAFANRESGSMWAYQLMVRRFGADRAFRATLDSAYFSPTPSEMPTQERVVR